MSCLTARAMTAGSLALQAALAKAPVLALAVAQEEVVGLVVAGGVVDSVQLHRRNRMKSIPLTGLILAVTLSFGSLAQARGPSWSAAGGAGASVGPGAHAALSGGQGAGKRNGAAQTQSGSSNGTHTQAHTPGTGLTDADPSTGQVRGAGASRGIHEPGTGLTSNTTP